MFSKVLIANRGEIAMRIHRACRELGIATVAIHSQADRNAMHVRLADESVCVGPPSPAKSYLNVPSIIAAAEITGADAIHPGYGFLSENARFAEIVAAHGLTFIGPRPEHIRVMGDKIAAKKAMGQAGIPLVPGSDGAVTGESEAHAIAAEIGFPVMVKAAAGGGGRGMRIARTAGDLSDALSQARNEAKGAFGDDAVYLEKYFERPRHIEIQVMGDRQGHVVHLGERDCSIQRRHQKLWEEAPSPVITEAQRSEIGDTVVEAMGAIGYENAGTVEFLYEDGGFHFIEMNTRLQVEHPVTEMVTGIDIVAEQIRIAAGHPLGFEQSDVALYGHAIECRVNAEDPETFLPSPGRIDQFHAPGGPGIRVDSASFSGSEIPPYYDSLIGKLIVHATTREACLMRLRRGIEEMVVTGVKTTLPLHRRLVDSPDVQAGDYDIFWLERSRQS